MLLNKERECNWVFTKADGEKINIHSLETKFRKHKGGSETAWPSVNQDD